MALVNRAIHAQGLGPWPALIEISTAQDGGRAGKLPDWRSVTPIGDSVAAGANDLPFGRSNAVADSGRGWGDTLAKGRIRTAGFWPLPWDRVKVSSECQSRTGDCQINDLMLYPLS